MIVVTGASGVVGRRVVRALVARGERVRALSRRPADLEVPAGVEVAAADPASPGSLGAALDGADAAFLLSAEPIDAVRAPVHVPNLVAAARDAGVPRVVLLSVFSGGSGGDVIGRWWAVNEAAVTDSGIDATLLRPGRFFTNALGWAPMLHRGDTVTVPFSTQPAAGIDPGDIAEVAAVELTAPGPRGGRVLALTGPECLTSAQEVDVLAAVLGRDLTVVDPGPDGARAGMVTHGGMDPVVADAVVARIATARQSGEHADRGATPLPTVSEVLGRTPRTFTAWARANADAFAPGR